MTPATQAAILRVHREEGPPEPWNHPGATNGAILMAVAIVTGVTIAEMRGRRTARQISRARQVAYALMYELRPAMTWKEIAAVVKKDRTSVWHSWIMLKKNLKKDPEMRWIYDESRRELAQRSMNGARAQ